MAFRGVECQRPEYVADAIKGGVTDANWEAFKAGLNTYGYDFYIDFFNKKYHHTLND